MELFSPFLCRGPRLRAEDARRRLLGLIRTNLQGIRRATVIDPIKSDLQDQVPNVLADASRIHQIIMNLCVDAADAIGT